MAKLLLNLRHVGDDEADDVREFLDASKLAYYETLPSRWGISSGGIWISEDADIVQAKQLMAQYQQARQIRVRAEHAEAKRSGQAETFADIVRTQPLRVALTLLAVACLLGLVALPVLLLRG